MILVEGEKLGCYYRQWNAAKYTRSQNIYNINLETYFIIDALP